MDSELTTKQKAVYDYIKGYIRTNSFPPSVRDIASALGISSPATIHGHIRTLVDKGYLIKDDNKSRALSLVDEASEDNLLPQNMPGEVIAIPVVGAVAAGSPILAEENIEDTYVLPSSLVQGETFMLRVKGESMINRGIFDGDLVIVRKSSTARNGDIVVALIDDGATVKTFYKERDAIRLQPENDTMEPIYGRDITIVGQVVGLLRMGM